MNVKSLSDEQCWSIASYLRTAASRFHEFAEASEHRPTQPLKEQFEKQEKEANAFATLFENANFAKVDIGLEDETEN
jgi:hypothetical protein